MKAELLRIVRGEFMSRLNSQEFWESPHTAIPMERLLRHFGLPISTYLKPDDSTFLLVWYMHDLSEHEQILISGKTRREWLSLFYESVYGKRNER